MYSRQRDGSGEISVPPNYSGNAFRQRRANVHITPERQPPTPKRKEEKRELRQLPPPAQAPIFEAMEIPEEPQEQANTTVNEEKKSEALSASLLSPLGSLGTEEILLIALALIIFQSGKDPDLALILLALLFV